MGLDLGSILGVLGSGAAGASRGLGNFSQIQFAEQLRQAAEQRAFQEKQQLAQESFGREKELREFIANLTREAGLETQHNDLVNQAQQALGAGKGMGMPGLSGVDPTQMPSEDLNAFIGQLAAASDLIERAGIEKKEAPEKDLDRRRTESLIGASNAQARAADALATERLTNPPGTSQDRTLSDAQIQQVNMAALRAEDTARKRLEDEKKEIEATLREPLTKGNPGLVEALEQELERLSPEYIDEEVKKAGDRYRGLLGGASSSVDVRGIIDQVAAGQ